MTYLCVDQVTAQLAGPLGRLAGIEAAKVNKTKGKKVMNELAHKIQSRIYNNNQ